MPLETCSAFSERWNNKLYYKFASCWLFLLSHTTMHVFMNIKFETWCWRRMLQIKWTDRITNEEDFQKVKKERLLLKILNNRRHSWIGRIIRHNKFVVNILDGVISGKNAMERPRLQYLSKSPGTQQRTVKADSHIACRAHAVPLPCRALIHTCHAAPLPCSNSA